MGIPVFKILISYMLELLLVQETFQAGLISARYKTLDTTHVRGATRLNSGYFVYSLHLAIIVPIYKMYRFLLLNIPFIREYLSTERCDRSVTKGFHCIYRTGI